MNTYQDYSFLKQVIRWALYDREHSIFTLTYREIEPTLPELREVEARLRQVNTWRELIESHPIERMLGNHPYDRDPSQELRCYSFLPFPHLCLRYLVVATLARRIGHTWMARIGRETIESNGPQSLFFGTTSAAIAQLHTWNQGQRKLQPWSLAHRVYNALENADHGQLLCTIHSLLSQHAEADHPDVQHALGILEPLLRAPIALVPERDDAIGPTFPLREFGLLNAVPCDRFFLNCLFHDLDQKLISSRFSFLRHESMILAHHHDPRHLASLSHNLKTSLHDIRQPQQESTLFQTTSGIDPHGNLLRRLPSTPLTQTAVAR